MSSRLKLLGASVLLVCGAVTGCGPGQPPPSPIPPPRYLGLDSYLHWDKLPYLEIGTRVAGQSTADPAGSNQDNVNTLGTLPDGQRVLLDNAGPGITTFMRMQQAIGSPWNLAVDGAPPTVINGRDLGQINPRSGPATRFPYPLSLNIGQSQGSSIVATELPYAHGLKFTSSAPNGNFYSLSRKLPIDAPLEGPTAEDTNRAKTLLNAAGTDITPPGTGQQQGVVSLNGAGTPTPVTSLDGTQEIRSIKFRVPFDQKARFGNARLQIYWDGETAPSVDAPMKFLAGNGAGVYQPAGRQLVQALPASITGDGKTYMEYSLYWPMPFTAHAHIALVASDSVPVQAEWSVRHHPHTDPPNWMGKFHANYTEVPRPAPGQDMNFLDYRGSGKLVGTVVNFGTVGGTLEGDPHIHLDDSRTPQVAVTGTEEWGMGGDYWNNGRQTSLPMAGLPSSTNNPPGSDVDGSAEYRFLIADSIPFNNRIVVNWEHGAVNDSPEPYRATMLWYGTPWPTAVPGDELIPGVPESAWAHRYHSPGEQQRPMTSRYEYTVGGEPVTGTVAATNTGATFTMALPPNNVGAFLRRTFDSCVANQRANVFLDGQFAGSWYNAGGTRRTEPADSSRCWRDDDLPLPRTLTAGKRTVDVRIDNVPTANPPNTVWTASSYKLFGFTMG